MKLADVQPRELDTAARALRPGMPSLGADLKFLLRFAHRGERAEEARRRFDRVMPLLFAAAGALNFDALHAKVRTPDPVEAPDAARAVVVIRAARGRLRLAAEHAIEGPDLAALSGLDESTVRWMARRGKLERGQSTSRAGASKKPGRNAPITAASAEALLRERNVSPFGAAP